jgi:hypothetical protein
MAMIRFDWNYSLYCLFFPLPLSLLWFVGRENKAKEQQQQQGETERSHVKKHGGKGKYSLKKKEDKHISKKE